MGPGEPAPTLGRTDGSHPSIEAVGVQSPKCKMLRVKEMSGTCVRVCVCVVQIWVCVCVCVHTALILISVSP